MQSRIAHSDVPATATGAAQCSGRRCAVRRAATGAGCAPVLDTAQVDPYNPLLRLEPSSCAFSAKRSPSTMCCWCRRSPRSCPTTPPRHPALPQHHAEPAAGVRRDGHRDRGPPRDRHRAGRRHRHRAQEPHAARQQAAEVARVKRYESGVLRDPVIITPELPVREVMALSQPARHLGLPGAGGQQGGRHRHRPRPALRDALRRAGARDHDAARAPDHRARRHHARRSQGADAQAQARARAGHQRRLRAARPDHRQGHHQADQLPERRARRARQAARRRGGGRGRGHRGARRAAGQGRRRRDRGRHRARPQRRRDRARALGQAELSRRST